MKSIFRLLICLALALPMIASAQQPDESAAPDKADVAKFLDLMHAREQMVQTLQGMERQMKLGAEQGFKQRVPNATPEQIARVDQLFGSIFTELPIDEMMDAIIPIYQKHLTRSELAAVTAFYSSPAGQKILTEMPAILSESMEAGGEIGRRVFSAKSRQFDQKVAELMNDATK